MSSDLYVITGATGNIGKKISEVLLSKKKKVRVIGRHADKLQGLVEKGAEAFAGSLDDAAAMAHAFKGAHAVFVMIPPNYAALDFRAYQNRIGETLGKAIQDSGVRFVVNLSSIGAHRADKLGPINGLYDQEQRLNKLSGVNILHLRPAYFMENQLMSIDLIKKMGINGSALRGDIAFPMIATVDIAQVAANALLKLDFKGQSVQELLGSRDISLQEATTILGKAIGKPDLKYVQFSYEDTEKSLIGMGFTPNLAKLFIEMSRGSNEGLMAPTQGRTPKTTTTTTFEEFAKVLANAYTSGAVAVH
jgi:uncharacterized protein YbjT (DUF2867 family)